MNQVYIWRERGDRPGGSQSDPVPAGGRRRCLCRDGGVRRDVPNVPGGRDPIPQRDGL